MTTDKLTKKELAELANAADANLAPTGTDGTSGIVAPTGDITAETTPKQPANADAPPQVIGQTPGETPRALFAAPETVKGEKQIAVVLDADYWEADGDRKTAGSGVTVSATKAKELIQNGKAHLPFPEDDR
ncbi:hypothetical protein ASG25_10655 [Rhizobium sp. Leaf384]|uniref:hypothetical protein n=1 Tax=Rhizobium sp. Leaf384 TaxID=1736358 RepID=UPI000713300E|nr:hypothetical protein [Rhizobium sp. Leaf384]KQS79038.1 hypothetical protein ASG25_10655 [Rhizobium sp. Leaf384]